MTKQQVIRLLNVCIIATSIMLVFEVIFAVPGINNFFSDLITKTDDGIVWLIIWLIMFLQCTVLNIPAYVVLSASISVGLDCLSWQYLVVVLSAYMAGCILAYWIGRWWGVKAVKWVAGNQEEYNHWCEVLNKKGKWWYFATVIFPLFPDDLLCIVAGAVKFNFGVYTLFNLVGRGIGLVSMILALKLIGTIGGGFPFMIIVWAIALIAEIIIYLILRRK